MDDTVIRKISDIGAQETSLRDWIVHNAQRHPDKIFIHSVEQKKSISYGEFQDVANRMAQFLKTRGIGPNDRVAMLSNNSIEHLAVYIGVMAYGATICTIHVEMNAVYFEQILNALKPKITLYEDNEDRIDADRLSQATPGDWMKLGNWQADGGSTGFYGELEKMTADPVEPISHWEHDASIYYTSGTASAPKGVLVTFRELITNTPPTADALAMTEDDRILEFRAFNWISAQVLSGLSSLYKGATLILARQFSQSRYFDWVREYKATIGVCNPTGLAMFLNRPIDIHHDDIPHLRFMTSSSAPLMTETWKQFEEKYGVPIAQGYGCSEIGWISVSNEHTRKFGTVGLPLACHRLTVVDQDGKELPRGETGEVELGGFETNLYRYIDENGEEQIHARDRLRTGDLGIMDDEGYIRITGRAKDLIIRGGVNISPAEVDNILLQMPTLAEAATIGVPDPIWGEEVVCYVAAKEGQSTTAEAVLEHCSTRLPQFRQPRQIIVRDQLPKTERGKMNRLQLLDEWKAEFGHA
ncbi:MAG: long-chain acyl-CoA synthetase [Alphaproteobacteria bacterium]|jgi:long-chain acyl-CoA synthetase